MYFLGLSIVVLLFLFSAAICSMGLWYLAVHWFLPCMLLVFLSVLLHILRWGRPYFWKGVKALVKRPETGDPAVADYFRRLTRWTLGVGIFGMIYGGVEAFFLLNNPEIIGNGIATMLLMPFYTGWLALMVFWPISIRFSIDVESVSQPKSLFHFYVSTAILGLAAFFLTRVCMAIVVVTLGTHPDAIATFPHSEDIRLFLDLAVWKFNPGDLYGYLHNYIDPQMYWDTPSLLIVVLCLWAFRLAAGKPKERMEWVPVSILIGVLWSIEGMIMMLCDLDPAKFGAGCMVCLLTAFYGIVAAMFFAIGSWRLVRIFFLAIFVSAYTWTVPQVFLVPFDDPEMRVPALTRDLLVASFFLVYGTLLYFLFKNVILGVRAVEQRFKKAPVDAEPMSSDEEQAQQILDSAVGKQKKTK